MCKIKACLKMLKTKVYWSLGVRRNAHDDNSWQETPAEYLALSARSDVTCDAVYNIRENHEWSRSLMGH